MTAINVGILGATGTVGQRFILLLSTHPYFKIHALGASSRSAGQTYAKAVRWKQSIPIPTIVRDLVVAECKPEGAFKECGVVFSGLDADVAGDIGMISYDHFTLLTRLVPTELAFRAAELAVFSNSKNHRRDPVVPLIVPLVNPTHLSIIPHQRSLQSPPLSKGFIVTNANCSTTGLVIPLAALEASFGPLETVQVTTLQAISGAGYPGVPSLDILDNVVPYIGGEEEKIEWETGKILGGLSADAKSFDHHAEHALTVSATCFRVPVLDGHSESVSVRFHRRPAPSPDDVIAAFRAYVSEPQTLGCPSAPRQAIFVHDEPDRPQPRLDRDFQRGAGVNVGRVRRCPVLDIKFVVLANNVCIGAATSSIINAEYAVAKGVIVA
ncbi:hypothetical protein FRC08_012106 [Ceratobasidium sp. 394]|nr:hypothetical protein FRC08_012106 [Ceratobasidium sp. 394]